jgi:hypothetical protein
MNTLMACERKYWHRKIAQTAVDSDYEESSALNIGKAFHHVMEVTLHTDLDLEANISEAIQKYPVPEGWSLKILAMCKAYTKLHEYSKLEMVIAEMEILEAHFVGYIDAIMRGSDGRWWIVDLKTAGRFDQNLMKTLPFDFQLNMYSMRYLRIAQDLNLDPKKFMGCRYRAVTKPSLYKQSAKETEIEFVNRMARKIKVFDIVVPVTEMSQFWPVVDEVFNTNKDRAIELKLGKEQPTHNYGHCMSYFRPCEYFSKCHNGKEFSETNKIIYKDNETYFEDKIAEEML